MHRDLKKILSEKIKAAVQKNLFPGCVIGAIRKMPGQGTKKNSRFQRIISCRGNFRTPAFQHAYITDKSNPEIGKDSIFDCASLTKVIPTSFLALQLLEKGKISLKDEVVSYLPEIQSSSAASGLERYELGLSADMHTMNPTYRQTGEARAKPEQKQTNLSNKIKIKHLLTQSLNFDLRLSDLKHQTPPEILKSILSAALKEPAGSKVSYCNSTSILLGLLIEKITDKKLYALAQAEIFDPLEMNSSAFIRPKRQLKFSSRNEITHEYFVKKSAVPSEIDLWRKRELQGEIHDESAWMLSKIIDPGSAGLFSNVPDLLNFMEMLLNEGTFHNQKLLKPQTVKDIYSTRINETGTGTENLFANNAGLGFELNQPWMGKNRSPKTIGKTGFTGCSILADFDRKIGIVILSNYTWPHRRLNTEGRPDKVPINKFRAEIADSIFHFAKSQK